jgi:hypothetical protein
MEIEYRPDSPKYAKEMNCFIRRAGWNFHMTGLINLDGFLALAFRPNFDNNPSSLNFLVFAGGPSLHPAQP